MELPFSGFELTFIIIAFIVFSLFSLASVCIQPEATHPDREREREREREEREKSER
ncbi:small integral membrane protein 31, partial [Etheostoma spectabile]|uniref:small integral membrane protein 31 n=1 Tax=Etheostoma spectabile TaxID=54343 RepID=UPI0013AFC227